jgi:hypothetical protein
MKKAIAVGISALCLAGCGVGKPSTTQDQFSDVTVNGIRCIVYAPSDTTGVAMNCDFAKQFTVPPPAPVDAGPPIDNTELSPPPAEVPPEPTP